MWCKVAMKKRNIMYATAGSVDDDKIFKAKSKEAFFSAFFPSIVVRRKSQSLAKMELIIFYTFTAMFVSI
jgi:hypothetical protein